MSTTYPGREDEHDLGDGFSFAWMTAANDEVVGLYEHHPVGPDGKYCGGYIAWKQPVNEPNTAVRHELVAGGPGDESSLTIAPSLLCRACGNHGFIRDGRWESV